MAFLAGRFQLCSGFSKRNSAAVLLGALAFAAVLFGEARAAAQPQIPIEHQVKAVFLYNFAQYTEWPTNAFASPQASFVIGILGQNPFGDYLAAAVRGEKAHGRPIEVKYFQTTDEARNSHILFISNSEAGLVGEILQALSGLPILTISEVERFAERGGMIEFRTTPKRTVAFVINPTVSKKSGLTISSRVLRLAEHVMNSE
jgi:hypothetical protein